MNDFETCPGYKIVNEKIEIAQKNIDEKFNTLLKHSDERDDRIEEKLDKIDDFLRNGFTDRILKTITGYFDNVLAKAVKIIVSTAVIAAIGFIVKLFFF